MDNLGNLPPADSGGSPSVTVEPCILCGKESPEGKALGRGRRKYCSTCKANLPPNTSVCVSVHHVGSRILDLGWFYEVYRKGGGKKYPMSYCKGCYNKPTKQKGQG